MLQPFILTESQIRHTINEGDFPPEILSSHPRVAVIMSQDWCPQWTYLQQYFHNIEDPDLGVYVTLYNQEPFYEEFMRFKEEIFKNYQIPYIRYYREGVLQAESNFIPEVRFRSLLGLAGS